MHLEQILALIPGKILSIVWASILIIIMTNILTAIVACLPEMRMELLAI